MEHTTGLLAAISQTSLGGTIGGEGLGPFAESDLSGTGGIIALAKIISSIIGIFTIAAAIWFIIHFLIGGLRWLESEGDKHKLEEAQKRLTNAFIGLIIVVAGWTMLALVGQFFGYDVLLANPQRLLDALQLTP
jgi:hypothetical protein